MPEQKKNVTAMRLTAGVAEKRIRETAKVTENVIFGTTPGVEWPSEKFSI